MQKDYSNETVLVAAINQKDPGAYDFIRVNYYRVAKIIVTKYYGKDDDVEDIYSEGIVSLAEKASKGKLVMSSKVLTLLADIWKKQWIN